MTFSNVVLTFSEVFFPPGLDITVQEVMGAPPFEAGAVKVTVTRLLPAVTFTIVGWPGIVAGVAPGKGFEPGPVPVALVPVTVNVYSVPFVRPVTIIGLPAPVTGGWSGGAGATEYVIGGVPVDSLKLTVTCPLPGFSFRIAGALVPRMTD